jgi:molecular chaperone DnaK (HSP70)
MGFNVSAIWSNINKQIMIEALLNAELIQKNNEINLFLSYEPEAAAYYCQNEGISIPENKPYIVCDLGDGTEDLECHMKIKMNNQMCRWSLWIK